jgi:organic radical activating enzyme
MNSIVRDINPSLSINITDRCNLACFYCPPYGENFIYCPNLCSLTTILDLIDLCDKNQIPVIRFTGGEPLLYPEKIGNILEKCSKSFFGKISVTEVARIMDKHGDNLLERNIRKYLGFNAVNKAIYDTLIDDTKRQNFFFYNNGITMICSDFKYNALQRDDWKVQIKDMQIINGGQTCKTIIQAVSEHPEKDFSETSVLLRLYAVGEDESVIEGITRATNSQNPVDFRDLKSNDQIQLLLEKGAKELGFTYKRKKDSQVSTDVIPASVAAEAVFAIWRQLSDVLSLWKQSYPKFKMMSHCT